MRGNVLLSSCRQHREDSTGTRTLTRLVSENSGTTNNQHRQLSGRNQVRAGRGQEEALVAAMDYHE